MGSRWDVPKLLLFSVGSQCLKLVDVVYKMYALQKCMTDADLGEYEPGVGFDSFQISINLLHDKLIIMTQWADWKDAII